MSKSLDYFNLVVQNISNKNQRLDLFISLQLPQYSRSFIKKTIGSNQVLVNDIICYKAGYKVQYGDIIKFPKIDYKPNSFNLNPAEFDLEILYEDEDYLFINKPTGLSVHPTNSSQEITLVNKLLGRYKNLPANDFTRPGIVHRLDKETSGVMVIAKNPQSLWWISKSFAERKVSKEYISIGVNFDKKVIKKNVFTVEGFIKRNSKNRKLFYLSKYENDGKYAHSEFKIINKKDYTNLQLVQFHIYPQTGRTHQIRVQQKSIAIPILGDQIYLSRKQLQLTNKFLTTQGYKNRLYLHAFKIGFENYDGKRYSIEANLPDEFDQIMS